MQYPLNSSFEVNSHITDLHLWQLICFLFFFPYKWSVEYQWTFWQSQFLYFNRLTHHLSNFVLSLISKEGPSQHVQAFFINRQHLDNTLLLGKTTEIKEKLLGKPLLNSPQLLQREKEDSTLATDYIFCYSQSDGSLIPVSLKYSWNSRCSQKAGNQYSYTNSSGRVIMPAQICQSFHPLHLGALITKQPGWKSAGLLVTPAPSSLLVWILMGPSLQNFLCSKTSAHLH